MGTQDQRESWGSTNTRTSGELPGRGRLQVSMKGAGTEQRAAGSKNSRVCLRTAEAVTEFSVA